MKRRKQAFTGLGSEVPPLQTHVEIYFCQKGYTPDQAAAFYQHHELSDWRQVKDWKRAAFHYLLQLPGPGIMPDQEK